MPCPYNIIFGRDTAMPCPLYREHLSFAFTVRAGTLAYCTIRERGRSHYNKKNAFYKTEMLSLYHSDATGFDITLSS